MPKETRIVRCQECGAKNRADIRREAKCGRCKSPLAFSESPITITDANFKEEVENSQRTVLLDLWATWCPPCKMIAPIINQLARELAGKAVVGKLDVDENSATAGRFRVQSIPTLLILKKGKEVGRVVGVQSKEAILQSLEPHL